MRVFKLLTPADQGQNGLATYEDLGIVQTDNLQSPIEQFLGETYGAGEYIGLEEKYNIYNYTIPTP